MPKLDVQAVPFTREVGYPAPYRKPVDRKHWRRLAAYAGVSDFELNEVILEPGGWSSQRHWHEGEDELVIILAGEATLVDDQGRTPLRAGDIATFPKNDGNGHHLINEGDADCRFLALSIPEQTDCHYPDIDLHLKAGEEWYRHKDGRPYPPA